MPSPGLPRYDRRAAAHVLAELARPGLFSGLPDPESQRIEYHSTRLTPEPGAALTLSQRMYLERFMQPATATDVTSATHRITWTDSAGTPNTGHFRTGAFGPELPIVTREAVLTLWRTLGSDSGFAARAAALTADQRAVLLGTTTDHEPEEIFRVGIEAAGRALAQHALLAADTPYREAREFAARLVTSGIFTQVGTRWFWELQAATYRRGMIAVRLQTDSGGVIRYTDASVALLRAMKAATVADARAVMARATGAEGLTVPEAIAKYHDDLDLISRQYALLPEGEQPACPAATTHTIDGAPFTVLTLVARHLAETVTALLPRVEAVAVPDPPEGDSGPDSGVFFVPDMSCRHCVRTIDGVLTGMGIAVDGIDLHTKRVTAEFRSLRNRRRAFEALRDGGYNPVDEAPVP